MDAELRKLERLAVQGDPVAIDKLARMVSRTQKYKAPPKKPDDCFTIDEIAKFLGVTTPSDFFEQVIQTGQIETYGQVFREAYDQAIETGLDEDEATATAEEAAQEAEGEVIGEYERAYIRAVEGAAEKYFGYHELELVEKTKGPLAKHFGTLYKVVPINDWKQSARAIEATVEGVGYGANFNEYRSPKQAVLHNLDEMKHYGAVYGYSSPERLIEISMRYL